MRWAIVLAAAFLIVGCESQQEDAAEQSAATAKTVKSPEPKPGESVRKMFAAGRFYPAEAAKLSKEVKKHISSAGKVKIPGRTVALVAPHASLVYSGHVAGHAYASVAGKSYDTVVILGSHAPGEGVSILDVDWYKTPFGYVKVDRETVKKLLEHTYYDYEPGRHRDHAIEIQVPFLQEALKPGFKIIALATNDACADFAHKIGHDLAHALEGKKVLLVASTDLSHYPPYESAKEIDGKIIDSWKELDGLFVVEREKSLMKEYAGTRELHCVMCGKAAVAIAIEAAKHLGADSIDILKYANSGDIPQGDKKEVVGYAAAAIYKKEDKVEKTVELSKEAQDYLLKVARSAIAEATGGQKAPEIEEESEELKAKLGVFVTLYKNGALRGCIGCFESDKTLPRTVAKYAVFSAMNDTRFDRMKAAELKDIKIKISVLSAPGKIDSTDEIEIGKHGIWICDPDSGRSGTYLPEVATEMNWNKEQFLTSCCRDKAGLPGDCWKKGNVEIYTYTTQIFGEK